jgi:hypothetical protein
VCGSDKENRQEKDHTKYKAIRRLSYLFMAESRELGAVPRGRDLVNRDAELVNDNVILIHEHEWSKFQNLSTSWMTSRMIIDAELVVLIHEHGSQE